MADITDLQEEKKRRKAKEKTAPQERDEKGERPDYEAFHKVNYRRRFLWVRTNGAEGWADVDIPYSAIKNMNYDGNARGGTVICINLYGDIGRMDIIGSDLKELHFNLLEERVVWIQEYDARRADWVKPEAGKSCIAAIRFFAPKRKADGT